MCIILCFKAFSCFCVQKVPYIMQGAVIPFLKQIVETETDARDELIGKLVHALLFYFMVNNLSNLK